MKIYVVGSTNNNFLPLNSIREKFLIDLPHDGDNIDNLNPWLCEMTGLYYLWKHEPDDIIGLEHYRRYFTNKRGHILSEEEIVSLLSRNDIIVVKAPYTMERPCKTWLINNDKWNDMLKFLMFMSVAVGDDYTNHCINHLNGDYHCLGNMFISTKVLISQYCSFIFPLVLRYMACELHYGRSLPPRICGYFTEFLFGAWLEYTGKKMTFSKWRKL